MSVSIDLREFQLEDGALHVTNIQNTANLTSVYSLEKIIKTPVNDAIQNTGSKA